MNRLAPLVLLILASASASLGAHEFWLLPNVFRVDPGEHVTLTLNHGERLAGEAVPRDERYIERFELVGPAGPTPVVGMSGRSASFGRCDGEGPHIAVFHAVGLTSELGAIAFDAYLREEGLEEIIRRRAELGESDLPGRERYERCAKALIASGDGPAIDRPVGLPLEIVLESVSADRVTVRVRYQGEPAAGRRVVAVANASPGHLLEATSDESGVAAFDVCEGDVFLITTIHMVRTADGDEQSDTPDWTSYWASLTFDANEPTG